MMQGAGSATPYRDGWREIASGTFVPYTKGSRDDPANTRGAVCACVLLEEIEKRSEAETLVDVLRAFQAEIRITSQRMLNEAMCGHLDIIDMRDPDLHPEVTARKLDGLEYATSAPPAREPDVMTFGELRAALKALHETLGQPCRFSGNGPCEDDLVRVTNLRIDTTSVPA